MNVKNVPKKQLWGIELNLISLLFSSISPVLNKFSVVGGIFTSMFAAIFVFTTLLIIHQHVSLGNLKSPWLWILGGTNAIGIILQYIALSMLSPITVNVLGFMFSFSQIVAFNLVIISLVCAVIYLMYVANNIIAKYLVSDVEPTNVLFYNHVTSALVLFCYALIIRTTFNNLSGQAVVFNFGGAFFNGFLSLLLFYTSLKFITAGKANIVRALGPLIVIIYSSFFFPVQVTPSLIFGAVLVISASTIVTFTKIKSY